jgi:hypothetical protein
MPADWGPLGFSPCSERPDLRCDVAEAQPAIALHALRNGALIGDWWPVPDLLSSTEFQHQFVTDVDDTGRPILRFGDGQYGELFTGVDPVDVWYRVGNGITGNIGADSLAHIVVPDPVPPGWPVIRPLRNPLPTAGGRSRADRAGPAVCARGIPRHAIPSCHRTGLQAGCLDHQRRRRGTCQLSVDRKLVISMWSPSALIAAVQPGHKTRTKSNQPSNRSRNLRGRA